MTLHEYTYHRSMMSIYSRAINTSLRLNAETRDSDTETYLRKIALDGLKNASDKVHEFLSSKETKI